MRLGYELVAGEASTDNLVIEPVVVTKADLPDTEITFAELPDYVEGWSKDATEWPAWIQTLEQQSK